MERKATSEIVQTLLMMGMLTLALSIQPGTSESSIPPDTEWSQTYGGAWRDFAYSVVQTSDGGYALAGETSSHGAEWRPADFWLVKTDSVGTLLWNRTYGGSSDDGALSMIQTFDGGYALTGYTGSYAAGSYDFWLVKTDSIGNMQWSRTYGGILSDIAESVLQTSDGGYAMVGNTWVSLDRRDDFWLVKTDSAGNMQWNKTYGGASYEGAKSVVQTIDGGYAIVGYTTSYGAGGYDFWLVKTDEDGNMLWSRTYGGTDYDGAKSVVQTIDGGYVIIGYTHSYGAGSADSWLVKTDSAGNMQWNKTYGGEGAEFARSVVQTNDGGYAIVGYTDSYGAGDGDWWFIKTDASGSVQWEKTYGGTSKDEAMSAVKTADGGYALAGATQSYGAGWEDFWLIKLAAPTPRVIMATVDIDPRSLNLRNTGQWITAYIELPEGYNAGDIDVSSMMLNGTIPVDAEAPTTIGDYDEDGVPDLMVKFNRTMVAEFILSKGIKYGNVALTLTGQLSDGTLFEGSDMIMVRMPGDVNSDGKVNIIDLAIIGTKYGESNTEPYYDIYEDGKTDITDLATVAINYGKTYT